MGITIYRLSGDIRMIVLENLKKDKLSTSFVMISGVSLIMSFFYRNQKVEFAWIAIILCGVPILKEAFIGLIIRRDIKADVLVAIAILASLYIGEYFAAGEVAFIMALGGLLETITSNSAASSIEELMDLAPITARLIIKENEETVPLDMVAIGSKLRVFAGEIIPLDGVILKGRTTIDQSTMTGESIPVEKNIGDSVMSGTVNLYGSFDMRANQDNKNSTLQRLIKLIESTDSHKAPIVRLADKWASYLVWIALTTAVITGITTGEMIRAVTVLVVFCPCAFILATPTAVAAAIGNASKRGVLIRSGDAIERMSKVDLIAFDKTATLTLGKLQVIEYNCVLHDLEDREFIKVCASAEKKSEHPIGKAIVSYYDNSSLYNVEDFSLIPGRGVYALVNNQETLIGNKSFIKENGYTISSDMINSAETSSIKGTTIVYVVLEGGVAGYITLSDKLRSNASDMVEKVKLLGLKTLLLTGDHEPCAKEISYKAKIDDYVSDLLPEEKLDRIQELSDMGSKVCMVGDGINDALALKSSFTSIAMGGIGSDMAVESSDAVLINDDIDKIPYIVKLSKRMMKVIKFNIIFSLGFNCLAVILSAWGVLTPVTAAIVHNVGSVAVVINSALLLKYKY